MMIKAIISFLSILLLFSIAGCDSNAAGKSNPYQIWQTQTDQGIEPVIRNTAPT